MVKTCAIASGSNGNCYFYEHEGEAFLVDIGISCRSLVQRMKDLSLKAERINAIFVTHEHSDHVRGIELFSRQFKVPVYITQKTLEACNFTVNDRLLNFIEPNKQFKLGNVVIHPFSKNHDAADPCSYMLSSGGAHGTNVSFMTDIGSKCENVVKHIKQSDVAFLESNYDDHMLSNGPYPGFLKKRIGGDMGHFSNYQAALLALEHATPRLKHVFLSHLSANNNTPELAFRTFTSLLKERKDLKVNTQLTFRDKQASLIDLE